MRDLKSDIAVRQTVAPAVVNANTDGEPVERTGFESATAVVSTGAIAGSGNFTAKLQHGYPPEGSPVDYGWEDVTAADLVGAFPAVLAANSVVRVGYIGGRSHLRVVVTKNSGTSIAAHGEIILGHAHQRPVA